MNVIGKISPCIALLAYWLSAEAFAQAKPSTLPLVERIWMGMEEGFVRPVSYQQVRTESAGYVAFHKANGALLSAGDHWGTIDPALLEIERRSFEVESEKLKQQKIAAKQDAQMNYSRSEFELHETRQKMDELDAIRNDPEVPLILRSRAAEAIEELSERVKMMADQLKPERLELDLELIVEDFEIQLERKKTQLHALEMRSNLMASGAGRITFGPNIENKLKENPDDKTIWIQSGHLLATISDDTQFELTLSTTGSNLIGIPVDQLMVFLQDSTSGALVPGKYDRIEEVDQGREIVQNYVFKIDGAALGGSGHAQGSRHLVHVYRSFSRGYSLVHKKDIAFLAPEVLEESGWAGLVMHLWPDAQIMQIGPQSIAIELKNAD